MPNHPHRGSRGRREAKMVELEGGNVLFETALSWMFDYEGQQKFMPKSVCQWDEDEHVMTVPEWLAINEGMV